MKYEELKGKSKDELSQLILDGKKELFNLRFQRTTGGLEKTHRFKQIRKEIARVKTYLNSNETIAEAPSKSVKKEKTDKKEVKAKKEKVTKKKKAA